jgi:hypothetical protein
VVVAAITIEILRRAREEKTLYQHTMGKEIGQALSPVCDCETELEGDIIRDTLRRNGVTACRKSNRAITLTGSLGVWEICRPTYPSLAIFRCLCGGNVEVLVDRRDRERAIDVLQKIAPSEPERQA